MLLPFPYPWRETFFLDPSIQMIIEACKIAWNSSSFFSQRPISNVGV
jgi:hypothetical protein